MGTTLTGTQINNTYPGLLKTSDNLQLGATEKVMGDGLGNDSTLSLGTTSASFTGTLDLSGATVTGLSAGGLVQGTGTNSMKSADFLTPSNTADASANFAVAIGGDTVASGGTSAALGFWAKATGSSSVAIGAYTQTLGSSAVGLGHNVTSRGGSGVAIGRLAETGSGTNAPIAIGNVSKARATNSITIGNNAVVDDTLRVNTVVIGNDAKSAQYSTAVGAGAFAIGANCIAVGDATAAGNYAIAIGDQAAANFNNTVAIGPNVSAVNWTDSVTLNQMVIANYTNLNFADNSAAATGGVPLGGVYHTDGNLKVRHT